MKAANSGGNFTRASHLFRNLRIGEILIFRGIRKIGDAEVRVSGMKMRSGEFLIVATSDAPEKALEIYARRWQIGTMFACPETRGFRFESAHLRDYDRMDKLLGIVNMNNIITRKAVDADTDALVTLLRELFSVEADFVFNEALQRRGLAMMIAEHPDRCVMVAEAEGVQGSLAQKKVIGLCSIQVLVSTAEGGPVGLVEDMVVHPAYRKKGIGSKLLASVEEWAKARGLTRLQLLADQNNVRAFEFYEKMNWKKTQLICFRKKGF